MSKKPLKQEAAPTFPICSKWENKYFYCMFGPNESYVLRKIENSLYSLTACADSSVITPENEIIPYSEFLKMSGNFIEILKNKLAAHSI